MEKINENEYRGKCTRYVKTGTKNEAWRCVGVGGREGKIFAVIGMPNEAIAHPTICFSEQWRHNAHTLLEILMLMDILRNEG